MVGNEKGLVFLQIMNVGRLVSAMSEGKQGFNWTWDQDFECSLIRH